MTIHEYSKQAISTLLDGHDIQNLSPVLIAQVFGIFGGERRDDREVQKADSQ